MKELVQWLAETGTNDWLTGFWTHNWMLITVVMAPIGAWLKGKHPGYWAKLATMLPFVGKQRGQL